MVTSRGILGPSGYHDCLQSIRVLGRLVEWTAEGITWEAPTEKKAADRCRANTMRAQYLSSDRLEIQVECRDLARKLQQPSSNLDEMGLKSLARFLRVHPRLIWLFKWQMRLTRIEAWCDKDHAGCIRTRKSVTGCALTLGNSTVSTAPEKRSIMGW